MQMTTMRLTDRPTGWDVAGDGPAGPRDVADAVRQHVDWVYSAALRQVGGRADLAGDVTQAVFLLLWQKPQKVRGRSLAPWLFQVTRYCASNALRAQRRRVRHERRAAVMNAEATATPDDPQLWPRISPLLDELIAGLRSSERELVLLRFYQGKSMAQIGGVLGISEDAARKRVAYVVGKLRQKLQRRGVTAASELTLATTMMAHMTHISPAAVKAAALGAGASAGATTAHVLALAKGATTTMAIAKLKAASIVIVALGIGAAAAVATPLVLAQSHPATPRFAAAATTSASAPGDPDDDAVVPFLNARTDMVQAIDPFAIDWNALDAARDQLQNTTAAAPGKQSSFNYSPSGVPIFSHQMTAVYRRWTGEFRAAGGKRIFLVSQVGLERENPGAFELFSMSEGADPRRITEVCTPSSYSAQQYYEARSVGKSVVAANRRMVTALETASPQPRPDLMEALRASRMPIRIVWSPQQCRLAGRPSVSNAAIDGGTDVAFSGAEWDKAIWMVKGYTPPPTHAAEIIIKCTDDAAARALRDWIGVQIPRHKRVAPNGVVNFGAVTQMNAINGQVRIVLDPTPTERVWLLGNTFNVAP